MVTLLEPIQLLFLVSPESFPSCVDQTIPPYGAGYAARVEKSRKAPSFLCCLNLLKELQGW